MRSPQSAMRSPQSAIAPPLVLAAVLVVTFAAVTGCEKTPMDVLTPNQAPRIAVSAGPIRDSTNVFIATFNWYADDNDGQVTLFRYAIDDTTSLDDWFETDDFELTLVFTAPDPARVDSIFIGAATVPLERYVFNGGHTFFIKAVDDDGAESIPAAISFTAETLAPESSLQNPNPAGIVNLGSTFTISWDGHDPDGTEGPVGYSWRLIKIVHINIVSMSDREIEQALMEPESLGSPWSPFEARTELRLNDLAVPGQYIFGLRAIDQAGAVEPRMRTFRSPGEPNVLLIRAEEEGGRPRLRVSSSIKTTTYPTGDDRQRTFQIPANADVLFTWEADATAYGGNVAGYSYGIDLDDLSPDNPGWSPESATLTRARLHFNLPAGAIVREHLLYIRVRDDVGTVLIAEVMLIVVPLRFERDVLYVDDWGRDSRGRAHPDIGPACERISLGGYLPDHLVINGATGPQDFCHDAYLRDSIDGALDALGHPAWVVDRYEPLHPVTGHALTRGVEIDSTTHDYWVLTGPITLEQLSRYKLVIWNVRSFPTSALKRMNVEFEDNFLAVYLDGGGRAWISGSGAFVRTLYGQGNVPGLGVYGFDAEDFVCRYLKICSIYEGTQCTDGCFRQSGTTARYRRENGFEGAYLSPMAEREGFPPLRISRPPFANNPLQGIPSCDAMVVPYGLEINPTLRLFGGRLDTLYFYESNWRLEVQPPGASWMDDGASAFRYRGPDQGNLMMFGFPLFYLPEDQLSDMLVAGIRWLLED